MNVQDRLLYRVVDELGVPKLQTKPTISGSLIPVGLAGLLVAVIVFGDGTNNWYGWPYFWFAVTAMLTPALIFLGIGYWTLKLWSQIRRLRSTIQLADELGVAEHQLVGLATARG